MQLICAFVFNICKEVVFSRHASDIILFFSKDTTTESTAIISLFDQLETRSNYAAVMVERSPGVKTSVRLKVVIWKTQNVPQKHGLSYSIQRKLLRTECSLQHAIQLCF